MTGRVDTAEGRKLQARVEAARSFGGEIVAATVFRTWAGDNADGLLAAAEERDTLREALEAAKPALGLHARDFSQRALVDACALLGGDPYEWSRFPDVLDRLRKSDPEVRAALASERGAGRV